MSMTFGGGLSSAFTIPDPPPTEPHVLFAGPPCLASAKSMHSPSGLHLPNSSEHQACGVESSWAEAMLLSQVTAHFTLLKPRRKAGSVEFSG